MLVVVALAVVVVVGAWPGASGAGTVHQQAARSGASNASGTLSCTVSKGALTVSPGLSFSGTATAATFTFTAKLVCSGSSGVKGGTLTASGTSDTNNCGTLATQGIPPITATVAWKGKFTPSTIVFSNGNFSIPTPVAINLPSTGPSPAPGSTTVTGSFAYEPVSATFIADQSISAFEQGCYSTAGLTGFTFDGANGASTFDVNQTQGTTPPATPVPPAPATIGVDASSPGSAVNEGLIGVNHIPAGAQSAFQAIGTQWARTDVSFELNQGDSDAAYNCTTGAWNPSYLDGNVAIDKQAGANVELIVDYFPLCIDYQIAGLSSQVVKSREKAYEALVYQMAMHEIGTEGVTTFEVWNEPNAYMTQKQYLTLYKFTADELEKAATKLGVPIEVGGPGYDELGQIDNSWIAPLVSYVVANKLPLNFIDWHQYANDPDEGPQSFVPNGVCDTGAPLGGQPCWYNPLLDVSLFDRGPQSVESLLSQYTSEDPALKSTVLWVDEWGVDSGNDARLSGPYGAAFVAASLDNAQQGGIGRMSFYDADDDPTDPTYSNFGLLSSDLTPKPAYYAFEMWHQLTGSLLPVTQTPGQPDTGGTARIGAVASAGPDGTVNVLVYNFDPYDPTGAYGTTDPTVYDDQVALDITGLGAGSYSESQTMVDGQVTDANVGSSTLSGPSATLDFTLPGEGVTLVTLTPSA